MIDHIVDQVCLSFHRHRHDSCARWVTLIPTSPSAFHFLLPWGRRLQPRVLPLLSWATRTIRTPPQVMSPTTTSSRKLMSSSPRSLWPSNPEDFDYDDITICQTLFNELVTMKEKACRPVCRRRQWVMIERWSPLFAVTHVTSTTDLMCSSSPWLKWRARARNSESKLWKRTD